MRRMGQGTLQDSKSWTCKGVIAMERTTREKLIELLENDDCPMFMVFGDSMDGLVDYLIAHGVTVQEWKPISEPPKEKGTYLVCTDNGGVLLGHWYGTAWNAGGGAKKHLACWMEKPQPPKGE